MTDAHRWGQECTAKVVDPTADCCRWNSGWLMKAGPLEHQHGSHRELEHKIPQGAESKSQQMFTRASSGEDGFGCSWLQVAAPRVTQLRLTDRLGWAELK